MSTIALEGYGWIDPMMPNLGASSMKWLNEKHYDPDDDKAFIFELKDPRLPNGRAIGKLMPLHKKEQVAQHSSMFEMHFLEFINGFRADAAEKTKKLPRGIDHLRTLPKIYATFRNVPVYAPAFIQKLPLYELMDNIHPVCSLFISEAYGRNLKTFIEEEDPPLEFYQHLVAEVLYTLFHLGKSWGFQHNDLHTENILIAEDGRIMPELVLVGKGVKNYKYRLPAKDYGFILWDYETSEMHHQSAPVPLQNNPDRGPPMCTPDSYVPCFDAHSFLSSLLEEPIPDEVRSFIHELYPSQVIPDFAAQEEEEEDVEEEEEEEEEHEPIDSILTQLLAHPDLKQKEYKSITEGIVKYLRQLQTVGDIRRSPKVVEDADWDQPLEKYQSTTDDQLFYQPGDDYLTFYFSSYGRKEEAEYKSRPHGRLLFPGLKEGAYIAYYKLCRRGWMEFTLPTPQQILSHEFFHCFKTIKTH